MSEEKFIEDDIDRILYHSIPITSNNFKGLWVLSVLFTKWHKGRKSKKQEHKELKESKKLILRPERELKTITI
ncbi:MAG: hypothetical protein ACTSV5_07330 [Promethearchaeota archaeon]